MASHVQHITQIEAVAVRPCVRVLKGSGDVMAGRASRRDGPFHPTVGSSWVRHGFTCLKLKANPTPVPPPACAMLQPLEASFFELSAEGPPADWFLAVGSAPPLVLPKEAV